MALFNDAASGFPIASATLPNGFATQGAVLLHDYPEGQLLTCSGSAASPDGSITLGFRTGESYSCSRTESEQVMGTRAPSGAIYHHPCSVEYQLDEIASAMLGQRVQAQNVEPFAQSMAAYASSVASLQASHLNQELQLSLSLCQTPMGFIVHQRLFDGALGSYAMPGSPARVLYLAIFRCGIEQSLVGGVAGINEFPSGVPFGCAKLGPRTLRYHAFWSVPMAWYAVAPQDRAASARELLCTFIASFSESNEFRERSEQIWQQGIQTVYSNAQASIAQNQTMLNALLQQQNAAWDRVAQQGRAMSADLDAWRAGQAQMTAAMDARFAPAASWAGGGAEADESLDDRVARWRHESTMGVNTYDREDGTQVEFSTQADRVFEQDLDPLSHVGTEHYYDDYVPDGWTELQRRF